MALALASAQNYLVGVQVRTLSLAGRPFALEQARAQVLDGITSAIRHLHDAASVIENTQRKNLDEPLTFAAPRQN